MTFLTTADGEETITLSTDLSVKTLDRSKLLANGARKQLARVCNRSANTTVIILYRFNGAPALETAFELAWGESFDIKGMENLLNVQFRVRDNTAEGTLYVAYAR